MTATMLAAPILLDTRFTHGRRMESAADPRAAASRRGHQGASGSLCLHAARQIHRLIFEKPSLRTRVTFEVGIQSMGGAVIFLDHTQARLGERECISDVARNLERWVHGIVARVYEQRVLEELAANSEIPVINALSDKFHPCQGLADFMTIEEKTGSLRGFKLAYVGDGNNVCNSLIFLAARLGVHLRIATPPGYEPSREVIQEAKRVARETRAKIELFTDPREAVAGAQGVYTDAWTSMGFEAEGDVRESVFRAYQVNAELMSLASARLYCSCTVFRRTAITKSRRKFWTAAVRGAGPMRKSHVCAENAILHTLFS